MRAVKQTDNTQFIDVYFAFLSKACKGSFYIGIVYKQTDYNVSYDEKTVTYFPVTNRVETVKKINIGMLYVTQFFRL